jgi:hypothetical protein
VLAVADEVGHEPDDEPEEGHVLLLSRAGGAGAAPGRGSIRRASTPCLRGVA